MKKFISMQEEFINFKAGDKEILLTFFLTRNAADKEEVFIKIDANFKLIMQLSDEQFKIGVRFSNIKTQDIVQEYQYKEKNKKEFILFSLDSFKKLCNYYGDDYTLDIKNHVVKTLSEMFPIVKPERTRGFEIVSPEFYTKNGDVTLPQRADKGSCAYDFYSPIDLTIEPNEQVLIFTDIKAYMLQDEVLLLNVRSSQGKLRVRFANTQGLIDASYYNNKQNDGNIGIFLRNEGDKDYIIKQNDRIAQGLFTKYLVADEDTVINTTRNGGFGSTNKKED